MNDRVPLVEAVGDELRALLSPVLPETFVREYGGRKPLFVKGFAEKYRGLFSRDAFIKALAQPGPAAPDFLRASFDKKEGPPRGPGAALEASSTAFNVTPEQAVPLFRAGATLCATQIEMRVPSLGRFVGAIKRQMGYPGRVTFSAYLSPPGAGFNWHFDGRVASTLQIEGTKRWRFSNTTAVDWPRGNGVLAADGTPRYADARPGVDGREPLRTFDEKNTTEVVLEPGDLLVLPGGAWHDARGGDGGSLALNLSFTPVSYTVLVRELLEGLLSAMPTGEARLQCSHWPVVHQEPWTLAGCRPLPPRSPRLRTRSGPSRRTMSRWWGSGHRSSRRRGSVAPMCAYPEQRLSNGVSSCA
jgi:hypothetical protein